MSKNIFQVYQDNPITTNQSTDLMYFGRAPYGLGDDTAMQFSDFSAQFGSPYTPSALTVTPDTNVTITLGGSPSNALLHDTSITIGWTGLLDINRGGTGVASFIPNAVLCGGTTSTSSLQSVASVGTLGQVLTSNGSGALPTFQNVPSSGTVNSGNINELAWYQNTGTAISGLPTANSSVLVTDALGVPSISTTLPSNLDMQTPSSLTLTNADGLPVSGISATGTPDNSTFLRGDGTWSPVPTVTPSAMTKVDDSNVTLTLGGTPSTSLLQNVSLTLGWAGQLPVSRGGTGVSSITPYSLLCGGTTSTSPLQNVTNIGTSGQVLTSNGPGALPTFQTSSPKGGLKSFQILTSGASATYTRPTGVTSILVEMVGGGGGGGGTSAATSQIGVAGSGGSGGYCRKYYASAAATYTYTIGLGGSGGAAGINIGTSGGSTTFDTMTAGGGGPGNGSGTAGSAIISNPSGAGGTSSGGDINVNGAPGNSGVGQLSGVVSGSGGSSFFGGGGQGANVISSGSLAGNNGSTNSGSGGSGAVSINTTTARAGGNGAAGIIIVWEFA